MNFFNNKCMLCLLQNGNIKNILSEDDDGILLEEKLKYLLPEENIKSYYNKIASCSPYIPKYICIDCLQNLNNLYKFKRTCLQNLKFSSDYLEVAINEFQKHNKEYNVVIKVEPDDIQENNTYNMEEETQTNNLEQVVVKGEPQDFNIEEDPILPEENSLDVIPEIETSNTDVEKETSEAVLKLLPEKSRQIYEKEYKCFQNWKNTKDVSIVNEMVLLAYFSDKSKKVKASTLWSYYSMLKRTLLENENCDISKYSKLITLLKKLNAGYKPNKSKIFESADVIRFLKEAPDDDYLFMKVVAIMGFYGACRSDELYKLEFSNVDDRESVMLVSLIDTRTKKNRTFYITDKECGVSVLEIVRKYVALRSNNVPHNKFFVHYRHKKCTNQAVGINTLYKVPKKIADFLNLPNSEMYTGHCFRRSATTVLANSGVDFRFGIQ